MASIYANSTLTIAASASSGPHEGLFRVAAPDLIGWSISNFPDIRARKPLQHDSERLPLLERGWVFQERLLSPRVLHFTDHELIWECMEHLDCECQRLENPTAHFWSVSKQLCHPDRWRLLKDDHSEITDVWMRLIMDYFQLALSKPDDIFPAISGIAKSFGEATGWDYFAGMWKQTMIHCLTWYTVHCGSATRCMPWRAPTFSWASIQFKNGSFYGQYDVPDSEVSATVVQVECCPKGDDPTGQLESGYLILSGTLIQATIFGSMHGGDIKNLPSEGPNARIYSYPLHADVNLMQAGYEVHDGASVFCLELLIRKPSRLDRRGGVSLVLIKSNLTAWEWNGIKGDCVFERIGLLKETLERSSPAHAIQRDAIVKIV